MTVMSVCNLAVCSALLSSLFALPTLADENDAVVGSSDQILTAPFGATVKVRFAHVYAPIPTAATMKPSCEMVE